MNSAGPSKSGKDSGEGTVISDENKKDVAELYTKKKRRKGNRKKRTHKYYSDAESEADSSKELSKYHSVANKRKNRRQGALSIFFKKSEEKRRSGSTSAGKTSDVDSDWDERDRGEDKSNGKRYTSINPTLHPRDRLRRMTVKDALMEQRMKRGSGEHGFSNLEKMILDNLNSHRLTGSMPDLTFGDKTNTPSKLSPSSTLIPEHNHRSRSTETKFKKVKRVIKRPDIEKNVLSTENQKTEHDNGRRNSFLSHAIIYNTQPQLLSDEIPGRSQTPTGSCIKKSTSITTIDGNNKNQQDSASTLFRTAADLETLSSSRRSQFKMSKIPNELRQSFEDSERERRESFGKFMDLRRKLPAFSQSSLARVRNEEMGEYSGMSSTDDDVWDTLNNYMSDSELADSNITKKIKTLSGTSFHKSTVEPCLTDMITGQTEGAASCYRYIESGSVDSNSNQRITGVKWVAPSQTVKEEIVCNDQEKCVGNRKGLIRFDTSKSTDDNNISLTEIIPGENLSPLRAEPFNKDANSHHENKCEVKEKTEDFSIQHVDDYEHEINKMKHSKMENVVSNFKTDTATKNGNGEKYRDSIASTSLSSEKDINDICSVIDNGEGREPYMSPRRFVRNRSSSNFPLERHSSQILPEKKYRSLSPMSTQQNLLTANTTNSNKDAGKKNGENKDKKSQLKYRRSFSPKERKYRTRSLVAALTSPEVYTCDADIQTTKNSVAVQTSLENIIDVYPSEDKSDKGNIDTDENKEAIPRKLSRQSLKKKHKTKENRKKNIRRKHSNSDSLDSMSGQSNESVYRSREPINEATTTVCSLRGNIRCDPHDTVSPPKKRKAKHTSLRDLISCVSSSALDVRAPSFIPAIEIEGVRSPTGRLLLDEANLLKKSRSEAELKLTPSIDGILSCRPFGQFSASSDNLKKSKSQPTITEENDRKSRTSSQEKTWKVEKRDDGAAKCTGDTEMTTKPKGKISILAIVALKRKLARKRKIKHDGQGLNNEKKEEAKDHESHQATDKDKYNTLVSIENEVNFNLSELAFLKETAILDDDYYDSNDFHYPSTKKISFSPIVSDEPLDDENIFGRFRERRESRMHAKQKKVLNCCKKFLAFLFSHIGLCTLVVAYSIMGGFIFRELEQPFEKKIKINVSEERKTISHDIGRFALSVTLNKRKMSGVVKEVERLLCKFQRTVWIATEENGWNGKDYTSEKEMQWSFASSLLFATTVMTTIGYGHVAPKTDYGRIVTIAYAILGIPLTLLCLTNIGDLMATGFRFLYGRVCCGWCCLVIRGKKKIPDPEKGLEQKEEVIIHQDDKHVEVIQVPTSVCILLMTSYIFLGTALFSFWEKWDMLKGTYFSFVTLSTIGLGDVVPGTTMWESEMKLVFCGMYLIFGLSLIAMCFNLVQEDVKAKCRWLGTKLGIIDSATSDV